MDKKVFDFIDYFKGKDQKETDITRTRREFITKLHDRYIRCVDLLRDIESIIEREEIKPDISTKKDKNY